MYDITCAFTNAQFIYWYYYPMRTKFYFLRQLLHTLCLISSFELNMLVSGLYIGFTRATSVHNIVYIMTTYTWALDIQPLYMKKLAYSQNPLASTKLPYLLKIIIYKSYLTWRPYNSVVKITIYQPGTLSPLP